jgi:alpha-mannosidase
MTKIFVVPHTHWDREWYLPFQAFRIRLVRLVDKLLAILRDNPDYRCFTLDGQVIILEDYLEIRPEREAEIREHVQNGRLLIGPWYVLSDEFLVSAEALIRNLMLGHRVCRRFGPVMKVGYTPDPFGHIGQLPQILRDFGIESAVFQRGLSDEPTELLWAAPDGSQVLVIYLRESYGNAAHLPLDGEAFVKTIERLRDALAPYAATSNLLLMNGTDHMEPMPKLPALIRYANERLDNAQLIHSSLPQYIEAVKQSLDFELQTIHGELRSSKRHPILSGVLSARMWIKQRNAACQMLLERWAEPFSAFAQFQISGSRLQADEAQPHNLKPGTWNLQPFIQQAWRYLLQNHPHDSICGCSVDQVHKEMEVRFDWVDQIGEEVTKQSLATLASEVNTAGPGQRSLVVFNPIAGPRTDIVTAEVQVPGSLEDFVLVDGAGREIPYQVLGHSNAEFASLDLDREGLLSMMNMVENGRIQGMAVQEVHIEVEEGKAHLDITLTEHGRPDLALVERSMQKVRALLADEAVRRYKVRVHLATAVDFCFVAEDVPGHGYKTYLIKSKIQSSKSKVQMSNVKRQTSNFQLPTSNLQLPTPSIENEFFLIVPDPGDGTLRITDKATGLAFQGLNRFVDGGDRGDEYNYCRPENDLVVNGPAAAPTISVIEAGPARRTLEIEMTYRLPASLAEDRSSRSEETVEVPIKTRISLYPGVRRTDFTTTIENHAKDHRLRVHFPTPIQTDCSNAEGHFDVIRRPLDLPQDTAGWIEQPVPTHPQRTFVDVNDGEKGLMVINKGLPEYEVLKGAPGEGVTVALTLLRSVGWLSRDDLHCRRGHAGPAVETPAAQCLGKHTFEYALVPHSGGWETCFEQAHAFNVPLRAIPTGVHSGQLPSQLSFVQIEPASLVISAIKQAEGGEGLIVRFYNISAEEVKGRLRVCRPFARATLVNLNEEELEELRGNEGTELELSVRGKQIVTVKFEGFGARRPRSEPTGF